MKQFPFRRLRDQELQRSSAKKNEPSSTEATNGSVNLEVPDTIIPPADRQASTKRTRLSGHSFAHIPISPPEAPRPENVPHRVSSRSLFTRLLSLTDRILQRKQSSVDHDQAPALPLPSLSAVLQRARAERTQALDAAVRIPLEDHLGRDLGHVQVHSGPASAHIAQTLNARAFTLGRDIYLGSQALLNGPERARLLTHEAVHTVQQGGQAVTPRDNLAISHPTDAAEVEAEHIATTITASTQHSTSRSLALREQMRAAPLAEHSPARSRALGLRDQVRATPLAHDSVVQTTAPLLQRNLNKTVSVTGGEFKLNFKNYDFVNQAGPLKGQAEVGMKGGISFTAKDTSPLSDSIKLLQTVRLVVSGTGNDYDFSLTDPAEGPLRKNVMTAAAPGVDPGYFVDTYHKNLTARTKQTDPSVSPYYIDPPSKGDQEGYHKLYKNGKHNIKQAKLHDEPAVEVPAVFKFETAAQDVNFKHIYGVVEWGFTVTDIAKKTITGEYANLGAGPDAGGTSKTFTAAVTKFDDVYKNPGSAAGKALP